MGKKFSPFIFFKYLDHGYILLMQILNTVKVLLKKITIEMPKVGLECSPTPKPTTQRRPMSTDGY